MKTNYSKGLDISVLSLGTVQLGLSYGINNADGKPSQDTANAILNCAMANGINTLDTAGAYGDSEVVIGNWLKTVPVEKRPFIVTKAANLKHGSLEVVREDLKSRVASSKERLGVEQLDMLMLHHFDDYMCDKDNVRQVMEELKASGDVKFTGASAYSHHDYGEIAASGFDATQIPINVFDWGQIENGGMQKLADSGMMIFTRSVFLQGLVFHTPEDLDPRMEFCFPYLNRFIELYKEFELSPAALALSFVLSLPGVTQAVMGCDTAQQVESNCKLFDQTVTLTQDQLDKLHDAFHGIDPRVINPGTWFNKMK